MGRRWKEDWIAEALDIGICIHCGIELDDNQSIYCVKCENDKTSQYIDNQIARLEVLVRL